MTVTTTLDQRVRAAVTHATNRAARSALRAVLDLHQPEQPPEGYGWLDGRTPHCRTCNGGGDPYLASMWPCETYETVATALGIEAKVEA